MDELEQLRQKRMAELQQQTAAQQQAMQQVNEIETLVKTRMTKDAVSRYATLKSAHPEKAIQTLGILAQLIQSKQVTYIDDQHLKMLLTKINPKPREIKITRK